MRNGTIKTECHPKCYSWLIKRILILAFVCEAGLASAEDWGYDALDLASGGYNGDFTRVETSASFIWYQRIEQGNPTATGDQWLKFNDNGNWNKQWGVYNATTLTPDNSSVFTDTIDAGGSDWLWGNVDGGLNVNFENSKSYVFNVFNDDDIIGGPGTDVCGLAVLEINHQNALASFGTPTTTRSVNDIQLNSKSTAENASSNEEIWFQWTSDDWSTKTFSEDTTISADTTLTLALDAAGPKEGQTVKWLAVTTTGLDSGTVDDSVQGVLKFDAAAINKLSEQSLLITDDDTTGPVLSGLVVNNGSNVTDAEIAAGGYTIAVDVQDSGSGVNNNGTTVSGDDFSPNYDLLNNLAAEVLSDKVFSTIPADGAAKSSSSTMYVSATAVAAGSIDLGSYEIKVSVTDNDEDPSTSANDRSSTVDTAPTGGSTFTVVDDDATAPVFSSLVVTGTGSAGAVTDADIKDGGYTVAMQVQDSGSGININAGVLSGDDFTPNYDITNAAGVAVVTDNEFGTTPSDGEALASAEALSDSAPAASGGSVDLGTYSVAVSGTDNDGDRTASNDREAVINASVSGGTTFTVVDDDTDAPTHASCDAHLQTYADTDNALGLIVTTTVQDTGSGVKENNTYVLKRGGSTIDSGSLVDDFATGEAKASAGNLTVTLAAGDIQTAGTYSFIVTSEDNDVDRTGDTETKETTFTFTVTSAGSPSISFGPETIAINGYRGDTPSAVVFGVTNSGTASLTYTNTLTYSSGAAGWLSSDVADGTLASSASADTTLTPVKLIMDAGTYYATNTITGNQDNGDQTVVITLTVSDLGEPTGQSAAQDATNPTNDIDLTWSQWSGRSVLILRRAGAAVADTPVQGTTYTTGTIGDSTIVSGSSSSTTGWNDDALSSGTTYHYAFFSENYAFYSPAGVAASVTTEYNLGNCWHIPANPEPPSTTMRAPSGEPTNTSIVYLYSGNQYQGAGTVGDQTGGTVYFKKTSASSWSEATLNYNIADGNNKYFMALIAADTYSAGDNIQYYLKVTYNDRDTTYIGTTDSGSSSTVYGSEADAQSNTFRFSYYFEGDKPTVFCFK